MAQLKVLLREAFGSDAHENAIPNIGGSLRLFVSRGDDAVVTFDELHSLAEAFGTQDISVNLTGETQTYSDVTGGESSRLEILIEGISVDLEWEQEQWVDDSVVVRSMVMRGGVVSVAAERAK